MKLIYCPRCKDVKALHHTHVTRCYCEDSGGRYINSLDAEIWGYAIPLGFSNQSFLQALENRPQAGQGEEFVAFVIPKKCKSILESG